MEGYTGSSKALLALRSHEPLAETSFTSEMAQFITVVCGGVRVGVGH